MTIFCGIINVTIYQSCVKIQLASLFQSETMKREYQFLEETSISTGETQIAQKIKIEILNEFFDFFFSFI